MVEQHPQGPILYLSVSLKYKTYLSIYITALLLKHEKRYSNGINKKNVKNKNYYFIL